MDCMVTKSQTGLSDLCFHFLWTPLYEEHTAKAELYSHFLPSDLPLMLLGSKRKAHQQNLSVNIPAKCAFSALSMLEQGARLSCPQDICLGDDGFAHLSPLDLKERNLE